MKKTCGDCSFYRDAPGDDIDGGPCYLNPPTVVTARPNARSRTYSARPIVLPTDLACSHFQPETP